MLSFIDYLRFQLKAYKGGGGLQAFLNSNTRKLAEKDEQVVIASGIPYTIIQAGTLLDSPGGVEGFNFEQVFFFDSFYLTMVFIFVFVF